jgi:N-acetylglucosaminyldiphosphoundecaprenol N-acetyl-beta-D-mannosaminyltransferase
MVDAFSLRVRDADITVNTADRPALMEGVRSRFRTGSGFAIATLNLDHLVKLRQLAAFRRAYERQDLVVADGNPIVWLSRLAGRPVSLVTGSDLVEPLAELAAEERVPVALLGATSETLARAASVLVARSPGLRIVARLAPGPNFDPAGAEADEMIDALRRSGARLTFLALGAPRQEMFAARCRRDLPDMGLASIGAGLDFIAASQKRAPRWVRRMALEWLWRMLSNPRRLAGRYASCAMTLPGVALTVMRAKV